MRVACCGRRYTSPPSLLQLRSAAPVRIFPCQKSIASALSASETVKDRSFFPSAPDKPEDFLFSLAYGSGFGKIPDLPISAARVTTRLSASMG